MTEIKGVSWLKQIEAHVAGDDGLGVLRVAKVTFDPTGNTAQRPVAVYPLGSVLPASAIIVGGFMDVNTAFTSAGGNAGEIAISLQAANDVQTSVAVSGAPWSTIGRKAIVPKANTPESTSLKTSAAKQITATVITQALTAGKVTIYLYYLEGVASA